MNEVRNVYIGFHFGKEQSQIAYYDRRMREAVCVPDKAGDAKTGFPTDEELYLLARHDSAKEIDGRIVPAEERLAAFFAAGIARLGLSDPVNSIATIMLTAEEITETMVSVIRRAFLRLGYRKEQLLFMDENESFYQFVYAQNADFYAKDVALFSLYGDILSLVTMHEDRSKRPSLVRVTASAPVLLDTEPRMRDLQFLAYATEQMEKGNYSGVLLMGDGFSPDEMKHSIAYLLKNGRKVFYGDNLFVQGACFGAYEKRERHALGGKIFVSKHMISANLGMEMRVKGEAAYYPLIVAGTAWFEAEKTVEFLLDDTQDLCFILRPMEGGGSTQLRLPLHGLPKRPPKASRIRLTVSCPTKERCHLQAEDLGLGEFYPATHRIWEMDVDLLSQVMGNADTAVETDYILCAPEQAQEAYHLREIGTSIRSMEELCFFFYHYSALLDEAQMTKELVDYVGQDLGFAACAEQMEAARKRGGTALAFVAPAFREIAYLSRDEINRFGAMLMKMESLSAGERMILKAEALIVAERFAAAKNLLRLSAASEKRPAVLAQIHALQGRAALAMMQYDEALQAYESALACEENEKRKEEYLYALVLAKPQEKQALACREHGISEEMLQRARTEVQRARETAASLVAAAEDPDAFLFAETARYHAMQGA